MQTRHLALGFAILGVLCLALARPASANITPTFVGVSPDGANWDYTYDIVLDDVQELKQTGTGPPNSEGILTLYDFKGFTAILTTPGGWSSQHQALGVDILNVTPDHPDSAAIENVTIKYIGSATVTGPHDFGDLVIQSSIGPKTTFIDFAAQAINIASGLRAKNGSFTEGPAAVPLPAASWMGLVLIGVLGLMQSRRARA